MRTMRGLLYQIQAAELSFRHIMLASLVFGLAAHAYCYFNIAYSHDSLFSLVRNGNYFLSNFSLGRFMQGAYLAIRGPIAAPWLVGICSLFFLALAAYFFLKVVNVHSNISAILICGLLVTNLVVSCTNATYLHDADMYALALAISIFAVLFWMQHFQWKGTLGAAFLIAISMGFYQAYAGVSIVLLLFLVMEQCMNNQTIKANFVYALHAAGVIILAFFFYYLLMRLSLVISGINPASGYNGVASLGDFSQFSFTQVLFDAWIFPFHYLLHPEGLHPHFLATINLLLVLILLVSLLTYSAQRISKMSNAFLLGVLVLILPLGANYSYIASQGVVHTLMLYAVFLFYPFCIVCAERALTFHENARLDRVCGMRGSKQGSSQDPSHASHHNSLEPAPGVNCQGGGAFQRFVYTIVCLVCACIVVFNIVGANQAYLLKQLQFEATESVVVRVIDRIEQTDGYVPGQTPVFFLGTLMDSELFQERTGFEDVGGVGYFSDSAITYDMRPFFSKVLGYPIHIIDAKSAAASISMDDIDTMDVFPQARSCLMINNVLVVRLTNNIDEETLIALSQ